MMSEDLLQRERVMDLLTSAYQARHAKDYDACVAVFTEQARFRIIGDEAVLPFWGARVGRARIRETLIEIDSIFRFHEFEVQDIIVDGDRVAVRFDVVIETIATGERRLLESFDHIVLLDGLIQSYTQFFDTHVWAGTLAKAQS